MVEKSRRFCVMARTDGLVLVSNFDITVCGYKTLYWTVHRYLKELAVAYHPPRSLTSESGELLTVPQTRGATYGSGCFGKAASTLWNNQ